jgi:hypothetical protein
MMEMETTEKKTFTYSSRKEYEKALCTLVSEGDDDGYELLAEEYLRFCDMESEES